MRKEIQVLTERLSRKTLENAETYNYYTDKDLLNACLIFHHFFMDKIYIHNMNLPFEKKAELAELVGKGLRELILATTGKDMHDIAKNI